MRSHRIAVALSAANLVLLVLLLTAARPAQEPAAPAIAPVLRGRALEIVDATGRVRSRINVEPEGGIVLRMISESGTIRVKLGAGDDGSGLLLADETTEPGLHLLARRKPNPKNPNTTRIMLQGSDGHRRLIEP